MDVKQAIDFLRNKLGDSVKGSKDAWIVNNNETCIYSDRDLIKLARDEKTYIGNSSLKKFMHKSNRAKTSQDIKKERYEDLPPGKLRDKSDPWAWD